MGTDLNPIGIVPERLNLSIGHACFVRCRGCYNVFGSRPASLAQFEATAEAFIRYGVRAVTLSGGDPLSIPDILGFVRGLRSNGIGSIKIDTVGTVLWPLQEVDLGALTGAIDVLGLPLDGWNEESVSWFRRGRPALFAETTDLLEMLEARRHRCDVYINTVVHAGNLHAVDKVFDVVRRFRCVRRWNVF